MAQGHTHRIAASAPARRAAGLAPAAAVALALVSSAAAAAQPDDDILFTAELTSEGETAVVDSPGVGRLDLWLERETLEVRWTLTFRDLTSRPVKAGLFGPEAVGFNAGLQVDFGPALKSPVEGRAVLTDGQFQYLIATRMYVNVLTERYPDGEIRGHLRRQPRPQD